MTRFARAKGSKASNERVPEEATSWQEMKRQMEERKNELEEKVKKIRTKSENETNDGQSSSNVDTAVKWASFQDSIFKKNKNESTNHSDDKGNVKFVNKSATNDGSHGYTTTNADFIQETEVQDMSQKKSKKMKKFEKSIIDRNQKITEIMDPNEMGYESDDAPVEATAKIAPIDVVIKPQKRKKERITIPVDSGQDKIGEVKKEKLKISEKACNEKVTTNLEGLQMEKKYRQDESFDNVKKFQQKKARKNKNNKNVSKKFSEQYKHSKSSKSKFRKVTDNKPRNDKEYKRRKLCLENTIKELNSKNVEMKNFGGFMIKKEDANRLFHLRNQMRKKGVPESEIAITLKLERRKAEKALARENKKLCFNCRKSGHELLECPDLNDNSNMQSIGTGICLKCGSTEHTHFECKVVRSQNYKFAICFICKEEGHISKQCPDNPKGIYPKGGCCRVCQDVSHLKRDCPLFQQQQESVNTTLNTIGSDNIELLESENKQNIKHIKMDHKRIVKF